MFKKKYYFGVIDEFSSANYKLIYSFKRRYSLIRGFAWLLMTVCLAQLLPGNFCICWLSHAIAHADCENCHDEDCEPSFPKESSSHSCDCFFKNADAKISTKAETHRPCSELVWLKTLPLFEVFYLNPPLMHLALQKTHPPFLPRHLLLGILLI